MCNDANRRLVMAYAEHKEGEPYTKCDEILSECMRHKKRVDELTAEYNLLTLGKNE